MRYFIPCSSVVGGAGKGGAFCASDPVVTVVAATPSAEAFRKSRRSISFSSLWLADTQRANSGTRRAVSVVYVHYDDARGAARKHGIKPGPTARGDAITDRSGHSD